MFENEKKKFLLLEEMSEVLKLILESNRMMFENETNNFSTTRSNLRSSETDFRVKSNHLQIRKKNFFQLLEVTSEDLKLIFVSNQIMFKTEKFFFDYSKSHQQS
jgi:hypothetical protein